MNEFFTRIMQFAEYKGFKNTSDFAKNGLFWDSSEKLNRLKKENNKPSIDILIEISNKFEDVNVEWLITGKGEMLKKEENIQQANNNVRSTINQKQIVNHSDSEKLKQEIQRLQKENSELKDKIISLMEEKLKL